ncbi:MAG: DUF2330 domain-containing protein, partial [Sedimentisphaerales bacterium]|nr:DUF2330 domain-containing protein [Sedimentisphaerales bacterium]
ILVYKDGIEKLTIESSLDGKGHEFGWIIPLPSVPTEFKKVSPGLIQTFSLAVQPKIIHDLKNEINALWRVALLITLMTLILVGTQSTTRIVLLIFLLFVSIIFFTPTLGVRFQGIAFRTSSGIRIYDVKEIGRYDLAVLEADNSEALNTWLLNNGFTGLSEKDESIVSDYVKDHWCFVAAKLRRENEGYSKPHPLSMSFVTDVPIYPVRLTGTTGADVYLELFVIAEKRAVCKQLTLDISDTYHLEQMKVRRVYQIEPLPGFVGKSYHQAIGHPDARKQMWDGCVLSRFSGVLTSESMSEDISLQLQTKESFRKFYYSHRGARGKALAFCFIFWCILPVVLAWPFFRAIKQGRKFLFLKWIAIPVLLFSFLIYGITYAVLPKTNIISTGGRRLPHWMSDYKERRLRAVEIQILAEEHDGFASMNKDEIATFLSDYFISKDTVNIFTGESIKIEDSPGNYTLIEDDRGIVWRTYSMEGYPDDCVLVPMDEN